MPAPPPFKASSIELTSILTQAATSTPAQPVNGTAALYAADSGGVTTLFVIKDDNTFFEIPSDHTIYTLVDGSRPFTGRIAGITPTDPDDLTTKTYVDSLVVGVAWKPPVDVKGYIGSRTATEINSLSPVIGDSVVCSGAGTPATGTSDALVVGDIAEYDGTSWKNIVTNVVGFVPDGTRLLVHVENFALFSPLTDGADEGKYAEFDGVTNTPTLAVPLDGDGILVKGENSVNENKQYVYDGTGSTGIWVQFGGTGLAHTSLSQLAWSSSGHVGTALAVAGFDGGGAAAYLQVGTEIQAYGAVLDDLNTLGEVVEDGQFIVGTAAGVFAYESAGTARTSLGLGETSNVKFGAAVVTDEAGVSSGGDKGDDVYFYVSGTIDSANAGSVPAAVALFGGDMYVSGNTVLSGTVSLNISNKMSWFDGPTERAYIEAYPVGNSSFDIVSDGSVRILPGNNTNIYFQTAGGISIAEKATPPVNIAGRSTFWVKSEGTGIPMFSDDGGTDFELGTDVIYTQEYSFPESPGNTINERMFRPFAITITSIEIYTHTAGTTAGIYNFYFGREGWPAAGSNLLAAGYRDLKFLAAEFLYDISLSGFAGRLDIPANTVVNLQFVSDNVDLTGFTGIKVFVNYKRT
tara:strand:- start:10955 stop:12853 length:1899 start_codon:yes stop_codon:yes gene_type:complete